MARVPTDEEEEEAFLFIRQVGVRVRSMRTKIGITRRQMTERANIKPAYGYLIEGEGQNFTLKTLRQIAIALRCLPRDLLPDPPAEDDLENDLRMFRENVGRIIELYDEMTVLIEPLRAMTKNRTPSEPLAQELAIEDKSGLANRT